MCVDCCDMVRVSAELARRRLRELVERSEFWKRADTVLLTEQVRVVSDQVLRNGMTVTYVRTCRMHVT